MAEHTGCKICRGDVSFAAGERGVGVGFVGRVWSLWMGVCGVCGGRWVLWVGMGV